MKRIFSFLLAALMLVSAVPTTFATNDYTAGTKVEYTATGSESYTITVPAQLAPGGSGTVTLSGTWAENRVVTVTAEPTVTLTNSIKADDKKVLDVTFAGISEAGSNTSSQTFTESVSVTAIENALFGTWSGKFNYNVEIKSNYIALSSDEDIYALSRILADANTKQIYKADQGYSIENDFSRFSIPDDITAEDEKIDYLAQASYGLTNDINLTMQMVDGPQFFTGIGSTNHPFAGTFDGNGKTITLSSNGTFSLTSTNMHRIALFSDARSAKITNTNIIVNNDIITTQAANQVFMGTMAGYARNTTFENCIVTLNDSNIGVEYPSSEANVSSAHIGGFVGDSSFSTYSNCTVKMVDSTVYAKGYTVNYSTQYGMFSVGGFMGFSNCGSDNTNNIGAIGNQIYNCNVVSNNSSQRNVIFASVEYGEELTAGGLVGCTFNNFVAKNCSVDISNGNIVAEKTGNVDNGIYGVNVGGIIGRLEHTGELYNCSVNGNYLNILGSTPESHSNVGGIVGIDAGPDHRNVVSLNKCSFNGNNTSKIEIEFTSTSETKDKRPLVGGIAGQSTYRIIDCSIKDTTIMSKTTGIAKSYAGGIAGQYLKTAGFWKSGTYFTPDVAEMVNCSATGITFDVTDNVVTGEMYGSI